MPLVLIPATRTKYTVPILRLDRTVELAFGLVMVTFCNSDPPDKYTSTIHEDIGVVVASTMAGC